MKVVEIYLKNSGKDVEWTKWDIVAAPRVCPPFLNISGAI